MKPTAWERFRALRPRWQVATWVLLPVLPALLFVHGGPDGRARRWRVAGPIIGVFAIVGTIGSLVEDDEAGPVSAVGVVEEDREPTTTAELVSSTTAQPATTSTTAPTTSTAPPTTTTAKPDCQRGDGERDTRNLCLYASRADRQDEDHEAPIGGFVRLAGYTAGVASAQLVDDDVFGRDLVIAVGIGNRDDEAQPYNVFDWRIQTENGQVLDPTLSIRDDDLGFGDLVQGGKVTGTVSFDINDPGTYYVIYKPEPFNDARGIWAVVV